VEVKKDNDIDIPSGEWDPVPEQEIPGRILAIDDEVDSLALLEELLTLRGYEVRTATEGRAGIEVFRQTSPDLVITDIRMPNLDGLQVLRSVREMDDSVPVILVTGYGDLDNAVRALRRGAYDFLLKPINPEILLNTVKTGVEHSRLKRFEKDYTRILEEQVEARTKDLLKSYEVIQRVQDASIFALAKLVESRDDETGLHLRRLQKYCRVLCQQLARRDYYREVMADHFIDNIVRCSVLHDIGKVAIPDSVLFNPGKFDGDEFEIMKRHPVYGGKALEEAAAEVGDEEDYLSVGRDVAFYHHEHWDGNGYPFGLKGEEIPLAARIVALADVYDAIRTERRYKEAYSHTNALELIRQGRGRHFDPEVVDAMLEVEAEFAEIASSLAAPKPKKSSMKN
jgi:putative two-component system response regulator